MFGLQTQSVLAYYGLSQGMLPWMGGTKDGGGDIREFAKLKKGKFDGGDIGGFQLFLKRQ